MPPSPPGQIFGGTKSDYFVAEATYPARVEEEEEEGDVPPVGAVPLEEKGNGCNMFVNYATTDPSARPGSGRSS